MTLIKHLVHSKPSIAVNNCNYCYCVPYAIVRSLLGREQGLGMISVCICMV